MAVTALPNLSLIASPKVNSLGLISGRLVDLLADFGSADLGEALSLSSLSALLSVAWPLLSWARAVSRAEFQKIQIAEQMSIPNPNRIQPRRRCCFVMPP